MLNKVDKNFDLKNCMIAIIGACAILLGGVINPYNRFLTGLILVVAAIALYFIMVFFVAKRNWLDIRAVFTGVWLITIGLAAFRLTNYQEQWLWKTWVLLAISYLMFQLGASFGINNGAKIYERSRDIVSKIKIKRFTFKVNENRLFWICVITTLIGLACFCINIAIKGFIPAFSDSIYAYRDFYTKFHVFAVAATSISGLCYYCIHSLNLNFVKKIVLWICIFYLVILFPILIVSRGVFIIAALPLAVSVFYLNKRKLHIFVLCILIIGAVYLLTSNLRGYTDEQLGALFEPSDIVLNEDESEEEGTEDGYSDEVISFSLPPRVAFLYGYLTVSHDNFNEAVENTVGYTWGARQLHPFNVILRIQSITDAIDEGEFHKVRPHLNTVNMMGLFYYDFHELGVIFCSFFWALLFGLVQGYYEKSGSIFSLLIHGFSMNAVALSFFSSWVDSFELWMFCGVVLIITFITCINIDKKNECLEAK